MVASYDEFFCGMLSVQEKNIHFYHYWPVI